MAQGIHDESALETLFELMVVKKSLCKEHLDLLVRIIVDLGYDDTFTDWIMSYAKQ